MVFLEKLNAGNSESSRWGMGVGWGVSLRDGEKGRKEPLMVFQQRRKRLEMGSPKRPSQGEIQKESLA